MAQGGNAVVLSRNTRFHATSLRRPRWRSRRKEFKLHHYRIHLFLDIRWDSQVNTPSNRYPPGEEQP
jgi:hypothetical protein